MTLEKTPSLKSQIATLNTNLEVTKRDFKLGRGQLVQKLHRFLFGTYGLIQCRLYEKNRKSRFFLFFCIELCILPYAPEKVVLRIIPAQAEWSVFVYNEVKMATDFTCANFAHVGADADQTYKLPMKGR